MAGIPVWLVPLWACIALAAQAQAPQLVEMAGDRHVLALWADGVVTSLGDNRSGQAGRPAGSVPFVTAAVVPLPGKAIRVAAGSASSYALLEDGSVWAWGDNQRGQLGLEPKSLAGRSAPGPVPGLARVTSLFAEMSMAMAVLEDGTVRAWGALPQQLAPGRRVDLGIAPPVAVDGLGDVVRLSGGQRYGFALTRTGRVLAWGVNHLGQLGLGQTSRAEPPTMIPGLRDVVAVTHGTGSGAAVTRDGRVWTWGHNGQAGLGNGERADTMDPGQPVPLPVTGIGDAVEVKGGSVSGRHILVRRRGKTLTGWGNTDWGQLGTGGVAFVPRPTAVKLPGVEAYWPFGNMTFAVTGDGSLWFWGDRDMALELTGIKQNLRSPVRVNPLKLRP